MKLKNIIIALAIGSITLSNNVWCYADETPSKAINILTKEEYQNKNSLMEQERLRIEQEILEEIKDNPVILSEAEVNPMGLPDIDPVNNPASDNWLTREIAKQVGKDSPVDLTQEDFSKIDDITLNNQQITNIPKEIGNLINLQSLQLFSNEIDKIPIEISNLSNLRDLFLGQNYITEIPIEIFNLPSLQFLWLEGNQINTIPKEISASSNLQTLYLNDNYISEIPKEISNLSNLRTLWLQNNQITTIPKEISNLSNLKDLWLHNNQITEIPKEISNLTNISFINLRNQKATLYKKYIQPNENFNIKNPLNIFENPVLPNNISNNGSYNPNNNTITWISSDISRNETFNFSHKFDHGEFSGTVTLPIIIEKEEPLSLVTSNNTASQTINANDTLSIPISLKGTGDYYALDTQIEYNSELLEFKGYSIKNGLKACYSSNENNTLRYILASQGKDNPINSSVSDIVYLNFTPKKAGITDIKIKSGKIANLDKEVDINDLGSISITIEEQTEVKDINRDGKFTLIDLAIDGYYYGMNVNETDNTKYDTDIISDGKIDDTDLKEIVKHILNNPDYSK